MRADSERGDDDSRKRSLLAVVGYVALALALVVAFVPGPGTALANVLGVPFGSPVFVILVGLGAGAYGVRQLYRIGTDNSDGTEFVDRKPERAYYGENRITGSEIDDSVDALVSELPESSARNWWKYRERKNVQGDLTDVAVQVLSNEYDVSGERAAELIADGSWTTDERAAAFLAGEESSGLPLRVQFLEWLSGRAYEHRVDATVAEIARHAGVPIHDSRTRESRTAEDSALAVGVGQPDFTDEGDGDGADTTSHEFTIGAVGDTLLAEATAGSEDAERSRDALEPAAGDDAYDTDDADADDGDDADGRGDLDSPYPVTDASTLAVGDGGDDS